MPKWLLEGSQGPNGRGLTSSSARTGAPAGNVNPVRGNAQAGSRTGVLESRHRWHHRAPGRPGGGAWLVAAATSPFIVTVAFALASSLVHIVGVGHPYFADASGVENDAHAIARGVPLYQDPAAGYTPLPYTPLFPLIAAALDHLSFWSGWTAVLSLMSGAALACVAGALAWRSRDGGPAAAAALGAAGAAALAWWLVACVPFNFLYAPRPDQLSWACGLAGVLLVPGALRGGRAQAVGMVLLVSASWWMKQTGVVAVLAATATAVLLARRHHVPTRRVLRLLVPLAVLNVAGLTVLNLRTGGWAWRFIVELPQGAARINDIGLALHRGWTALALPAGLAVVVWAPVVLRRRCATPVDVATQDRLVVLVAFALIGVAAAIVFDAKQGTAHNQFIGAAWALGMIAACGLTRLGGSRPMAGLVAVLVLGLLAVSVAEPARRRAAGRLALVIPTPAPRAFVAEVPEALLEAARHELVFHPVYSALGFGAGRGGFPSVNNVDDLHAGGGHPDWLIRALLERRFDVAYLFESSPSLEAYASGYGKREEHFLWKLNEIIRAGYEPMRDPPPGLLAAQTAPGLVPYRAVGPLRRRAENRADSLRACLGPYGSQAGDWDVGRGGGLWCERRPGRIRLLRTPARRTELRMVEAGRLAGAVSVLVPRGSLEVRAGAYVIRWRGSRLEAAGPSGRKVVMALGPIGPRRVEIRFAPDAAAPHVQATGRIARVVLPRTAGRLHVLVDARSGATIDLRGLRRPPES